MIDEAMQFQVIYGVDFSGAKMAGKNAWVACLVPHQTRFALTKLQSLGTLCGTDEREACLRGLVNRVLASRHALWGMDFPFSLPQELFEATTTWQAQLDWVTAWSGDAPSFGRECQARGRASGSSIATRRLTDREAHAPFGPYHYRIIHQTFHGMREVLLPLSRDEDTAVLPFGYDHIKRSKRIVMEVCPSSTLRALSLPHQLYKQLDGKALESQRERNRVVILKALSEHIGISKNQRKCMMGNLGGDALDAVIAAYGAAVAWQRADHAQLAGDKRYVREGLIYV